MGKRGLGYSRSNTAKRASSVSGKSPSDKSSDLSPFLLSKAQMVSNAKGVLIVTINRGSFRNHVVVTLRRSSNPAPLRVGLTILTGAVTGAKTTVTLLVFLALAVGCTIRLSLQRSKLPRITRVIRGLLLVVVRAIAIIIITIPRKLPVTIALTLTCTAAQVLRSGGLIHILTTYRAVKGTADVYSSGAKALARGQVAIIGKLIKSRRCRLKSKSNVNGLGASILRVLRRTITIGSATFRAISRIAKTGAFIKDGARTTLLVLLRTLKLSCRAYHGGTGVLSIFPFSSRHGSVAAMIRCPRKSIMQVRNGKTSRVILSEYAA